MSIFDEVESNVRGYCRSFPAIFTNSIESKIISSEGREYLDFFTGAGSLNYGHNNPFIKNKIIEYISNNGILHALDMHTVAKEKFLKVFVDDVLSPRQMRYKIQFCGPTGTNAVEAALKIVRKKTRRKYIMAIEGAFHGMTLGSLSITWNQFNRNASGVPLDYSYFHPFPGDDIDKNLSLAEKKLSGEYPNYEKPAGVIIETVQAEGGVRVLDKKWIKGLYDLCQKHSVPLICDDIQVGCYRTGSFFSFEESGIFPEIITLSKSISGIGLPMALVLIKPGYDVWLPGEHSGTFRGNQLAFIGAAESIKFAQEHKIQEQVIRKHEFIISKLIEELKKINSNIVVRGRGLIIGIDMINLGKDIAKKVSRTCFENGLIVETSGFQDSVLKLLPPLICSNEDLELGCDIIIESICKHV